MSRAKSRRNLDYTDVLSALEEQGISIRVASPKLVMEEVYMKMVFSIVFCWHMSHFQNTYVYKV